MTGSEVGAIDPEDSLNQSFKALKLNDEEGTKCNENRLNSTAVETSCTMDEKNMPASPPDLPAGGPPSRGVTRSQSAGDTERSLVTCSWKDKSIGKTVVRTSSNTRRVTMKEQQDLEILRLEAKKYKKWYNQTKTDYSQLLRNHENVSEDLIKLEQANKRIRNECDSWQHHVRKLEASTKGNSVETRHLKHQNNVLVEQVKQMSHEQRALAEEVEVLRRAELQSRMVAEKAQREAVQATATATNLFQMLETQVVKRKSTGHHGLFPNGDEIESMMRQNQQDADDFFRDLADLMLCSRLEEDVPIEVHEQILRCILAPTSRSASKRAEAFVYDKKQHLLALIGGQKNEHLVQENQLISLLWVSSMQARVMEQINSTELIEKPKYVRDAKKGLLDWAWEENTESAESMEGRSIRDFLTRLIHLQWVCQFSQPSCFLHPAVGDTIEYNQFHHEYTALKSCNVRVQHGTKVHVLYPGLYLAPPETLDRGKKPLPPKVKPLVVCFK